LALALGTRRSTIAAVTSALAAMALAIAFAGRSCRVSQPGPEVTVRDLLHAASTGDRDTVYELLAPATQAHLVAEAKHATDLVGATQRYSAKDLISIGSPEGVSSQTDITVVDERGDRATVQIVSASGRALLQLIRIDGRWRVDLPQYGQSM
jgi:hypothetical protein